MIWASPLIPSDPLLWRHDLDPDPVQQLRIAHHAAQQALPGVVDQAGYLVLRGVTHDVEAFAADYNSDSVQFVLAAGNSGIESATNIVISGLMTQYELSPLGMFELTLVGLPIALIGLAYMFLLGQRLIPERGDPEELDQPFGIRPYLARWRGTLAGAGSRAIDPDRLNTLLHESGVRIVKKGGKIVLLAECREVSGSELFHQWMTKEKDLDTIIRKIREKFVLGAHKAFQFAREMLWADVFICSRMDPDLVEKYHMHPLREFESIEPLVEESESIVILPQATTTLPVLAGGTA